MNRRAARAARQQLCQRENTMIKRGIRVLQFATLALLVTAILPTSSRAETGAVRVVFNKRGFIVGVGGGRGVLTIRCHHYPFRVCGMSIASTIRVSTTHLFG